MDPTGRTAAGPAERLFDSHPTPTLVVDGAARVLRANRAARDLLGADPVPAGPDAPEPGPFACRHLLVDGACSRGPDCAASVARRAAMRALAVGPGPRARAWLAVRTADGTVDLPVLVEAAPAGPGETGLAVLTVVDATDLARAASEVDATERALRETEARLRTVVDSLAEGVVVSTLEGQVLHWNPAALRMHGYASIDECRLLLPEFTSTFRLEDRSGRVLPLAEWPLARVLAGEEIRGLEVVVRRLDREGALTWQYGGSLVRDPAGVPLMAALTIRDVTVETTERELLRRAVSENEALLGELRVAHASVATLTGLLPMCAWCKRVRDDEGYWAQVDSYISAHSDARVSHGVCPDCSIRMWPRG